MPLCFSKNTISTATSAGDTPGIRLAAASDRGRCFISFCRASIRSPVTSSYGKSSGSSVSSICRAWRISVSYLYERSGKAQTNFKSTLLNTDSDLAQDNKREPYNFSFTKLRGKYNERALKDALLTNITNFLLELGTGFAYVGKEYRLQIAEKEKFIDLLFYNLKLSCYVVVEVKIGEFDFADVGQLGGYVVACNHLLRKEGRDNPTIGLLICKQKSNTLAQYALESSSQPLGISEYELEKLYPEKVEGTMPSIKEIEAKLDGQTNS